MEFNIFFFHSRENVFKLAWYVLMAKNGFDRVNFFEDFEFILQNTYNYTKVGSENPLLGSTNFLLY